VIRVERLDLLSNGAMSRYQSHSFDDGEINPFAVSLIQSHHHHHHLGIYFLFDFVESHCF
jgi:hypothetical protein